MTPDTRLNLDTVLHNGIILHVVVDDASRLDRIVFKMEGMIAEKPYRDAALDYLMRERNLSESTARELITKWLESNYTLETVSENKPCQ